MKIQTHCRRLNSISINLFIWVVLLVLICVGKAQTQDVFVNPILAGFYPDPSLCCVGDDYYLVNSTFAYYPGIPIFHSQDLVNWTQIGHVLDRPDQLKLEGLGVSKGIFAPAIQYHKGIFFLTTTLVDGGGNFVVTAKEPAGPWSDPVWLPQVEGIDPSLFFDDNGNAYIIFNGGPPDDQSLYDGHRALWMYEFDAVALKTIGQRRLIVNGGTDLSRQPIWIEGPHVFKKDGYYYLIAAEGGTETGHSEVVFRARTVTGPYQSYEGNPILTQRHLDPQRPLPVTCTGHADMVQTNNGEWWVVFLGCRPYETGHFNTGRETFMTPVQWKDGWPKINPGSETVLYRYRVPDFKKSGPSAYPLNGNFRVRDHFDGDRLGFQWVFLRTVQEPWYSLTENKGCLTLQLRPILISEKSNPSFVCRRQQHTNCEATAAMMFEPVAGNECAGLVAFQNETHYYALCKTQVHDKAVLQLKNHTTVLAQTDVPPQAKGKPIYLKISAKGAVYDFYYAVEPDQWTPVKIAADAKHLSTETAGGFVGVMLGMYASSQGKFSANSAVFDWFEYKGDDQVFKEH